MEKLYLLKNNSNIKIYVSNIGAGIFDITLPINNIDQSIILHPKDSKDYFYSKEYFGKPCGRTAGRITSSSFTLNNRTYYIENDLPYDVLHGGVNGISFKEFSIKKINDNEIELFYLSPDKESGYPGNLSISITYRITDDNKLVIIHKYSSDQDTLCNLTSHLYFNLTKGCKNNILDELVYINSDTYGALDENNVAIKLDKVNESFDFNIPKQIRKDIYNKDVQANLGYNHPYIVKHSNDIDASLEDTSTHIKLEFKSTYNALQFYTCNYPSSTIANSNKAIDKYDAVCMEFQHFPNGINSDFILDKKDIIRKGEQHIEETTIKFIF